MAQGHVNVGWLKSRAFALASGMKTLVTLLSVLVVIETVAWARANSNLVYRLRRRAFWGLAHLKCIVKLRRRVVVVAVLLSVAGAVIAIATTRPVYGARVVLQVPDLCDQFLCPTLRPTLRPP